MNTARIMLMALGFMGIVSTADAQLTENLQPHFGFMYVSNTLVGQGTATGLELNLPFNSVHVGAYYALAQANDFMSVGIDPSLNLGLNFGGNRINWMAQAPVFLMGRIGANATRYNTQKVGFGAGIGASITYLNYAVGEFDTRGAFVNPSAVIEGTLNTRSGPITGRLQLGMESGTYTNDIIAPGGFLLEDQSVRFGTFSLGIIYGF